MKEHDTPEKSYDLERLIFFSDGVFAIAITLLAIELHPPENWDRTFAGLAEHLAGHIVFYLISFMAIGAFWMTHRFMFRYVRTFSETASWINLLFLALVCLFPLANMIVGTGLSLEIISIYIGLIAAAALVGGGLWLYLSLVARVVDPQLTLGFKLAMFLRLSVMPPVMCGASLWVGAHYGTLPAAATAAVLIFLSTLIRSKPYGQAKAVETPEA